jgi:Mg-chelatase subunit ChlD
MRIRWLTGVALTLMLLGPPGATADDVEDFRVGPFYTDRPGEVSVVLELAPDLPAPQQAQELTLLENDEPTVTAREIKAFGLTRRSLALLLCVDISGTMHRGKGQAPLRDVKDALLDFIARLRPQDRVALMTFGTESREVSGFDDDLEHIKHQIRSLQAETRGNTLLYDALYDALDTFLGDATLPKRRRIVVISDGKDEDSTATQDSVVTKSVEQAVAIDAIGYGRIEEQYAESLKGLARRTRGQFVNARPAVISLPNALSRIFNYLTAHTSLVVYFDQPFRSKLRTDTAGIAWPRADRRDEIRADIPRSAKKPPQPETEPPEESLWANPLLWGLLLAGLLAGLLVVISLVSRRKPSDEKRVAPLPEMAPRLTPVPERKPATAPRPNPVLVQKTAPAQARKTQVGGYFPAPAAGQPAVVLEGVEGPAKGRAFSLEKAIANIGADAANDLRIDDEFLSARHAQLRYEQGSLYLSDLGSHNGTFVNDTRLDERAVSLKHGDRIRVGRSAFTVKRGPS